MSDVGLPSGEALSPVPPSDHYIDRTIELIDTLDFVNGYAAEQVRPLEVLAESIKLPLNKKAKKAVNERIKLEAARSLGLEVFEASRLPGRDWQIAIRNAAISLSEEAAPLTLGRYLFQELVAELAQEEPIATQLTEVASLIAQRREQAAAEARTLINELQERRTDPLFLQAAGLWANSADSQDNKGPDGGGFHAGLVHFFPYRASKAKSDRFKYIKEPMSVDGFIAFSNRVFGQMTEALVMNWHKLGYLIDDEGNKRVYVLCDNRDFIVAFQRPHERAPLLVSVQPWFRTKRFHEAIAASFFEENTSRLNKLGGGVRQLI